MAAKASAPGAPKRPGTRRPPSRIPAGDDGIVRIDDAGPDGEPEPEPERVPAFAIGDKVYTMLAHPPLTLAIEALDMQYRRGEGFAEVFVMRSMLGPEAYRALLSAKRMTRPQFNAITQKISTAVYGTLEEEEADPNR